MKTKCPHLVQQKALQEYAKICGLRSDYTLDTVPQNWNIIFQQNIERQRSEEAAWEREMASYCIKRNTWGGLQAQKAKMSHQKREHSSKSREQILRETWERKLRGTKILFQEVFGEAQLKLCSYEEAATRAPSCLFTPALELSSEDQKGHTRVTFVRATECDKAPTLPWGLRIITRRVKESWLPGRRWP